MENNMNMEEAVRYLTGSANESEIKAFESWLQRSSDHREQYEQLKRYWESTGKVYGDSEPDKAGAWKNIYRSTIGKNQAVGPKKQVKRLLVWSAAAIILLMLTFGVKTAMDYGYLGKGKLISYSADTTIREIILSDSTIVWLNAHSQLEAPAKFHGRKRKVYLQGEAFFEVKHNPKKPFRVTAKNTFTKVLGTSFDIRTLKHDDLVTVYVTTGKVSFCPSGHTSHKVLLTPGMKGEYKSGSEGPLSLSNTNTNYLAWKTKELHFRNAPLQEVCQTLEEYYKTTIVIDPVKAKNYLFTGDFHDLSLEKVLNIIATTLEIKFKKNNDRITVQF